MEKNNVLSDYYETETKCPSDCDKKRKNENFLVFNKHNYNNRELNACKDKVYLNRVKCALLLKL